VTPTDPARAARAVAALIARGRTVATAESLTGGLLCAALTSVPGASAVVRGGVVAYATDLKATLLGVPPDDLDRAGVVSATTALAMASGVRRRLGSDVGLATTGVAGPDPQDSHSPGTVHVAVASDGGAVSRSFAGDDPLTRGRAAIRAATVTAVLDLLLTSLEPGESADGATRSP
jgi:nicotinamide-nucleotide amidase